MNQGLEIKEDDTGFEVWTRWNCAKPNSNNPKPQTPTPKPPKPQNPQTL